jgi:hypothetical protein
MPGRDDFTPRPNLILGRYEHYKGNPYEVVDLACHSETLEWMVIYKPLYEHEGKPDIWVRPYEMFIENVIVDSKEIPRFKKTEELGAYSDSAY